MRGPYDPRTIANLMLDEGDRRGQKITSLVLQKLLYFAHGMHLARTGRPLVSGYFEAWQHGPVHPSVYRAFRSAGSGPIVRRAVGEDPLTGVRRDLPKPSDMAVVDLVSDVMRSYGHLPPGRLVELAQAKGSPWAVVSDRARAEIVFGMRIPDSVIMERFRHHKMIVGPNPCGGEPPGEDMPFA